MLYNMKFSIPLAAILKTAVLGGFQGEKNLASSSFPFYRHNLIRKNNKITLDSQVLWDYKLYDTMKATGNSLMM